MPRFSRSDFTFGKVLHVVRNPLDAIESYFNLEVANMHNQSIADR